MQEPVVLLVLLVLGGGVLEEFPSARRVGDRIGGTEEQEEGGDELGGAPQDRLLRRGALGVPARRGDLLVERIRAGGVLDPHVPRERLRLQLVAHRQARQHAAEQLAGEDLQR